MILKSLKENYAERIIICLAVVLAYASVWPNEFLFDDKLLLVWNEFLRHWSSLPKLLTSLNLAGAGKPEGNFYRPVQMLIYFLIYQAFGLSGVAFHALNVFLQALNACLLHHFGIRAGFKKGAAFAAALLWAVHPLHTVDIAYVASSAEPLYSSFCLLGLITLLPDFSPRKIEQALIFFILALGCKETAVIFPALAMITFFFVSEERKHISAYFRTWPLWLVAALYIAAGALYIHTVGYTLDIGGDQSYSQNYARNFINRILTCLATLPVYARLIIWPSGLHISRDFPVFSSLSVQPVLGAVMVTLVFLQILWGHARRGLALSFGFLWFAVALSPVTGIVFPIDALISEGWVYLPTMGLFLGVAQTAAGIFEKKKYVARLLVGAIAVSLGITTFIQNGVWRNTETLYQNIVQNEGTTYRLTDFLGLYYMEQHEYDKAAEQYRYEIAHPDKRALALWSVPHQMLGLALLHVPPDKDDKFMPDAFSKALPASPHIAEAIDEFNKALAANPDLYLVHDYLSLIYLYQGNNKMAVFHEKIAEKILARQGK